MIIQCTSCSRKFVVKDSDIPREGRMVQCGYCSVTWHQIPVIDPDRAIKITNATRRWIPVLLSLSANSPFFEGEETGFKSLYSGNWHTSRKY